MIVINSITNMFISVVCFGKQLRNKKFQQRPCHQYTGRSHRDIIFSNLTIETNRRHWDWWGSAEMCKFSLVKRKKNSRLGIIKDIVVDNVIEHVRGTSAITGNEDQPLENIRISNVQIFMNAENAKDKRATHAMKIENVHELSIRDLSVKCTTQEAEEKWQSALMLKKVSDFQVESFVGRQGLINSDYAVLTMRNVSDGIICNSRAIEGANIFASIGGSESKSIAFKDNNLKKAKKEFVFSDDALKNEVEIK